MIRSVRAYFAAFAFAAASLFAGPADAQMFLRQDQGGFYLGAGVGGAKYQNFCDDGASVGFAGDCDEKDTTWKVSGGYRFNEYIAAEVGYVDLGKVSFSGTIGGVPVSGSGRTDGVEFLAVGYIPLARGLSFFGKLGAYLWDFRGSAVAGAITGAGNDNGTDVTYGLGFQYDFTRNLSARVEWQRYNKVDVDTFGVAALWTFR